MNIKWVGDKKLADALYKKSKIDFIKVSNKNVVDLFNRAATRTPVKSGELRLSRGTKLGENGEFGYVKEYAAHVEYGHRSKYSGYVSGRYYLRENVITQKPIFRQDLLKAIKEA